MNVTKGCNEVNICSKREMPKRGREGRMRVTYDFLQEWSFGIPTDKTNSNTHCHFQSNLDKLHRLNIV